MSKAAETVAKAVRDPNSVSAVELVKRAIQLIEPGLAVNTGEMNAIANSSSLPGALKAQLTRVLSGEGGLDDNTRQGIINLAKRSYDAQAGKYEQARTYYQDLLAKRGISDPISFQGEAKPFSFYEDQAAGGPDLERLRAIAAEIKQTNDQTKIAALQQEATGISARLKNGR